MGKQQRALIVKEIWEKNKWTSNLEELNKLLAEGWRVISTRAMGAYGFGTIGSDHYGFASLVILERDE